MGYDERQQSNSSGALVAVIGVGLVLAILAIIAVAGVGLYWVRASTQQAQVVAMEQQATVATRTDVEAHRAMALSQLEQSRVAETPDPRLNFVLEIDREGNTSVDGENVDLHELKAKLVKLKDETSNAFSVQVDADPDCPVKHVIVVVDVCEAVGDIDYRIVASKEPDVSAGESKTDE
jgi:biopolymer transport protein ExbD